MIAQMATLSLAFRWPNINVHPLQSAITKRVASYTRGILVIFSVLSVLVSLYRLPKALPVPFKPGPRMLTAGIWTLHFGIDNIGQDSQRGVRDLVR